MNKTGFGYLRLPQLETPAGKAVDLDAVNALTDEFLSRGGDYFDTAYTYLEGRSEDALRRCLVQRHPRERFRVATKLPGYKMKSLADCEATFQEQLARCGVDFFDVYLLHWLNEKNYAIAEEMGQFAFLQRLKEAGKVRETGFSYHDGPELLDEILTKHSEVDYVQLQLNYLDWESPALQARQLYEVAVRHGKRIIVMEPVKGGQLAKLPAAAEQLLRNMDKNASMASWAVRFVMSLPQVEIVLSGMNELTQVRDNMRDLQPLTEEESALLLRAAELIRKDTAIPCTGCSYCTAGCPMAIPIPQYFALYNEYARTPEQGWKMGHAYRALAAKGGAAADCITCRMCEGSCPQKLPITEHLQAVAKAFA
ncbi:MAG: Fe-S oxidoreductase [Ruminococcaceae bacterium]|nr:Fe-S oxidoreductase [Oscillospiraceae bacterium]